jgi:hypothetical protein
MDRDPDQSRIVTVEDEAQGPFVPLDLGSLFAATRSSAIAGESTKDGVETTGPSSSDHTEYID